jgi:hypothetical protein
MVWTSSVRVFPLRRTSPPDALSTRPPVLPARSREPILRVMFSWGIAMANQMSHVGDVGTYKTYDVVNIMTIGKIWVQVSAAVSTAPVAAYANSAGLFNITASGNYNGGAMFRTNQATVSGLALVQLYGPKLVA